MTICLLCAEKMGQFSFTKSAGVSLGEDKVLFLRRFQCGQKMVRKPEEAQYDSVKKTHLTKGVLKVQSGGSLLNAAAVAPRAAADTAGIASAARTASVAGTLAAAARHRARRTAAFPAVARMASAADSTLTDGNEKMNTACSRAVSTDFRRS